MKNLLLFNNSLVKIFYQLLGWLFILLFYSFGNSISLPYFNIRYKYLKILILNKRLFGDMAAPAIFFTHYTSNFLSLFNLGLFPYLNTSFFVNFITLWLQKIPGVSYNTNDFIKLIKYLKIFFYILTSLVMTDNLSYYINAPKTFLFNNKNQKIPIYSLYLLVTLTLLIGSTIILWLSKKMNLYRLGNTILFINLLYKFPYKLQEFISPNHKNSKKFILPINIILWLGFYFFILLVDNISPHIPINYVQHQYQNDLKLQTYLPLKLNNSVALPIIFSRNESIICLKFNSLLGGNSGYINMLIKTLYIIFKYIYLNRFTFNPIEISYNFKKDGAIIEGLRPGDDTVKYLTKVIYNINILSSYYIIIICILSETFIKLLGGIYIHMDSLELFSLMENAIEILNRIKYIFMPPNTIKKDKELFNDNKNILNQQ